jgi:hypothetical protein
VVGLPAANNGKKFEIGIQKSSIKQGLLYERFKDNGKFGFSDQTRFSSQNPCDSFIFNGKCLYYMELKSTISSSISFNQPPIEKGGTPMIKAHQVKSLLERSGYPNVYCGLLLDFADRTTKTQVIEGGTYFIEINTFVGWCTTVGKKSINQEDAKVIGIPVNRKLKKVNYEYDVEKLLIDIENQYNTI